MNDFQHEWAIIHGDIEKYERFSLTIKLFSILIITLSLAFSIDSIITLCLALTLWLQDGIWKTFQKRLEARVIIIEQNIKLKADSTTAFQLYSDWHNQRSNTVQLIKEYLLNSLRPTVAYPHAPLALMLIVISQFTR